MNKKQTFTATAAAIPLTSDEGWMQRALDQASAAAARGEVPVGAVLIDANGTLLAEAGNAPVQTCDPTAHAEILALRAAGLALGNYRLPGCTLFVTLEPCPMCMAAIANARLSRVVFAAHDERLGACGSAMDLASHPVLNPHTRVEGGLLADASRQLLKTFFDARRPPKAQRLKRIAALEDLPNVDPALADWLRTQQVSVPSDLEDSVDDERWQGWLDERGGDVTAERLARLKALRHFVQGGPASAWRTFLPDAHKE